jgi:hypothetical protein
LDEDALVGVRDPTSLGKLPEPERKKWEAFWAEVKAMLDNGSTR